MVCSLGLPGVHTCMFSITYLTVFAKYIQFIHTHIHTDTGAYTCMYVCMYVDTGAYTCMYVFMYVCREITKSKFLEIKFF